MEDFIITYPDGLVINLKDRPSERHEPCDCICHKEGGMHFQACCNYGWRLKREYTFMGSLNKTYDVANDARTE